MGGHDHHAPPYTIPKASIYKVETCPELVEVQSALARQGLRDPWLRNEVWRYEPKLHGTHASRARNFFGRGFLLGLGACALTIAFETAFGVYDSHGHGDHHGEEHGKH